jgi:Mn2+/Fe2+ NRAMP family transporter
MARMRVDTLVGMGNSNIIALFIMLTTAATLNVHGVTDIQTSSQAAEALRPIACRLAFRPASGLASASGSKPAPPTAVLSSFRSFPFRIPSD